MTETVSTDQRNVLIFQCLAPYVNLTLQANNFLGHFPAEYCLGNNSLDLHLNVDAPGVELPHDGRVDSLGGLDLSEGVGVEPREDTLDLPSVQRGVGNLSILSRGTMFG